MSCRAWYIWYITCCSAWALVCHHLFQSVMNHHSFRIDPYTKLAIPKRPVEIMWHDENTFDTESSTPDFPFKSLEGSSTAFIRRTGNFSILIEHPFGTKKIDTTIHERAASGLLKNLYASINFLNCSPSRHHFYSLTDPMYAHLNGSCK
jgi:hypothetical protein